MSTFNEIKEIPKKFQTHRNRLVDLLKRHDINGVMKLIKRYRNNSEFQIEWNHVWSNIAKEDGGKLSLTTVGVILGSVLGGVGIAAMGGAIGLPLALILGLTGFVTGSMVDDSSISINLPKDLLSKINIDARDNNISTNDIIEYLIRDAYEAKSQNNSLKILQVEIVEGRTIESYWKKKMQIVQTSIGDFIDTLDNTNWKTFEGQVLTNNDYYIKSSTGHLWIQRKG